jgi:formylglycine-generating enzyme required for sulfatase activity
MKWLFPIVFLSFIIAACQPVLAEIPTVAATVPNPLMPTVSSIPLPPTPSATTTATMSALRISAQDGMTQLYVPAGRVHMGGLDVWAEDDEKPAHVVQLDAYWIDQVEVINGMYQLCVQAGACKPPAKFNSDNRGSYFDNPEFQDYPVVYVSWLDADRYCAWAGRRLPMEAEWERAVRGDDMRTYPWGDELPSQTYANFDNLVGDTSRVGSYAAGASPFGALDMAGNVWEWVADLYKANYYAASLDTNPKGPAERAGLYMRVLRGGSFQDERLNMRVSNRGYAPGPNPSLPPQDPAYEGSSSVKIGFRCAADN